MGPLRALYLFLRAYVLSRATLAAENLALRQQLSILQHTCKRPKLRPRDRLFWVWLSRLWPHWRTVLHIVQPDTVIKWHQQGFKLYWRWKSKPKTAGRPPIDQELRALIRRMALDNPSWGAPHILSELRLLGYEVS
jgi:putative transposase